MQIRKITAVSASVTWKPLSKSSINGKLTKYVVNRKETDGNGLKSFDATDEKIDVTNLRPFTKYLVQVAACNSAGSGPKSKEITFTTAEAGITMMVLTNVFMHAVTFITAFSSMRQYFLCIVVAKLVHN